MRVTGKGRIVQHRRAWLRLGGLGFCLATAFAFGVLLDDDQEVLAVTFTVENSEMIERKVMNSDIPFLIIHTTDGQIFEMKNFDGWHIPSGERYAAEVWEADGQIMKYPRIRSDSMRRLEDTGEGSGE